MAAIHGKNAHLTWNSVDLSPFLNDISLSLDIDLAETTTFGDGSKEYISGIKDATIDASGIFDGAASAIDATLGDALGTSAAFTFKANSGATSTTNPKYTGTAILTSYEPSASLGDAVQVSASWQVSGTVTRATSDV